MNTNIFLKSPQYTASLETLIEYCRITITDFKTEQLWLFFLDSQGRIIDNILLEKGNSNSIAVTPNKILSCVVTHQANNFVLVHTHPSDNLCPSIADKNFTEQIYRSCLNIGIKLQDHIIIGKTDYFSFAQSGILYDIQHRNTK